ncbi:MAG: hypothetical protein LBF84_01585 [Holosporales bacterium]|jgi:3-oxoacyl-ACP reductase-like protein|nr:hypothetical protein [Holosporales bacterium]
MNDFIKFAGIALLLGCTCPNVVFASALPPSVLSGQRRTPKNKFTPEEDAQLTELVEQQLGVRYWKEIAEKMDGRNARQCRERWVNYLAPGVSNGPWTPVEDAVLTERYVKLGPKWNEIALFFPRRTDIHVKNRWILLQRRMEPAEDKANRKAEKAKAKQYAPPPPIVAQNFDRDDPTDFGRDEPLFRQFDGNDPFDWN